MPALGTVDFYLLSSVLHVSSIVSLSQIASRPPIQSDVSWGARFFYLFRSKIIERYTALNSDLLGVPKISRCKIGHC